MAYLTVYGKWRAWGYFRGMRYDLGGHESRERATMAERLFDLWAKKGQVMPPPKIFADI